MNTYILYTYTYYTYIHILMPLSTAIHIHQLFRILYTLFWLDTVNIYWWWCISIWRVPSASRLMYGSYMHAYTSLSLSLYIPLSLYIYIYIMYTCIYTCCYMCVYIHIHTYATYVMYGFYYQLNNQCFTNSSKTNTNGLSAAWSECCLIVCEILKCWNVGCWNDC